VNIAEVKLEKTISTILGNALDEIPKLTNNEYDFVFIDGMMRRSKDFLEICWPKTKTG
jgi:predicted O-methyltransferase YrrM